MSRRRKAIPREPVEAHITSLSHEGRGIAHINGKTTFIRGALPDETVMFQYSNRRGQFDEGIVTEVLNPSAKRIDAKCAVFGICGGCSMQMLPESDQIAHKNVVLQELFAKENLTPNTWLPPLQQGTWGYRSKARLGVRYVSKKGGVLVGFRELNGRFLTDMQRCEVLHPLLGDNIHLLREWLVTLDAKDQIPQLEVAVDDQRAAFIIRHLAPLSDADQQRIIAFAQQHDIWMYLQPKGPDTIHKLWPADEALMTYALPQYDLTMAFHPADFTQVNVPLNRAMLDLALAHLQINPTDRVLDLFCGLGNFSLPLARQAGEVVGVEGDQAMTDRAGMNAQHNGITNTEFFAADLFQDVAKAPWFAYQYDRLLLDPPRAGAQEVIRALKDKAIERIVYISCNPATLARDAAILVHEQGYQLEAAGVMDMFPQTSHVESIAVFTLSSG